MDLEKIYIDKTTTVKQAGGMQFNSWVLGLVNKSGLNSKSTSELNYLAGMYPGVRMSDDKKIEIINKLIKIGISMDAYTQND